MILKPFNTHHLFYLTTLWIFLSFVAASQAHSYDFYYWEHGAIGYETSFIQTEMYEKPLVLYLHVLGDERCEKMNQMYLASDVVEDFLRDMYKVEININQGDDEKTIASKYVAKGYPAFLVLMPAFDMKPARIGRTLKSGDMTPNEFVEAISATIVNFYNKKGYSHYGNKEYEKALKYYEMSLKHNTDDPYTHYAIGVIYHTIALEEKNYPLFKEAEKELVNALKFDPNHKESIKELKNVRLNMDVYGKQ